MRYLLISILFFAFISCSGDENQEFEPDTNDNINHSYQFDSFEQKIAYCIGLDHAEGIIYAYGSNQLAADFDLMQIEAGLLDYLSGADLRIPFEQKDSLLNIYFPDDPTQGTVNAHLVSREDASYAIGMEEAFGLISALVGREIDQTIDVEFLMMGIQDGMEGNEPLISPLTAQKEVTKYYSDLNKSNGEAFLADNQLNPDVNVTASGLQYTVVKEGTGTPPNMTDSVTVHYTGYFIDGRVFESTIPSKIPGKFTLMGLIPGWQEGLSLMGKGGQYRFYIPYQLAYGETGQGAIEPFSTLVYDIELLDIKRYGSN